MEKRVDAAAKNASSPTGFLPAIACLILTLALAASFVPLRPASAASGDDEVNARVEALLASGEYVEGEAVAIVRAHAELEEPGSVEQLAEVGADAVEEAALAVEQGESAIAEEAVQRIQDLSDETFEVKLVVDHGRTTEQILRDLYEDPDVISAEPNYVTTATAAFGGEGAEGQEPATLMAEGAGAAGLSAQSETNLGELTSAQWAMDGSLSTPDNANTPLSPTAGYSMNVPGWADGRTDANAVANASGTVCVMDTGFDADHPDLKDVLYEFTPEQQEEYQCGRYGYNASGDGLGTDYLRPSMSHGSHVAGIIAAKWDAEGVSGVAHGVRIFCVNVFGGNGSLMTMSSVVKGFQFLVDVSGETNLKAVNCSWGIKQPQFAFIALINELGKKGVNTIIAAGNDHENLDETIDLSSQAIISPYAITVDSAMPNGKSAEYSSYGQTSTDVFAAGSHIMSTVPVEMTGSVDKKTHEKSGYARYVRYFPEATAAENRLAYERFSESTCGVRVFKENPALREGAEEIAPSIADGPGYGDQRSLAVAVSQLNKQDWDRQYLQGTAALNGYVYLAIPVDSADAADGVKWASVDVAMSDAFKPSGGLDTITCAKVDGGDPVEVDLAAAMALDTGYASAAVYRFYETQWSALSYNVDGIVGAYNDAHDRMADGESISLPSEAGAGELRDLGKIGGVYAWQDEGKSYVIARVAIGMATNAVQPTDETKLYIDNVSLGNADAYSGAYEIMSGTSMASPATAGCIAVIANGEEQNEQLSEEELELRARERAAKLLASVEYDDDLSVLCRTGGRVNLNANPGFTKKAPLLQRAESDGDTLTIIGSFFGTSGTLEIDDVAVATSSWDDGCITADISDLVNGSHVAKITNEDGAISRIVFAQSREGAGAPLLYENTLPTPASVPGYENDSRIYGPMVACGGCVYAQTATVSHLIPQALWRYDIEGQTWSRHALPKGYSVGQYEDDDLDLRSLCKGGLVACRDTLYLYGGYQENADAENICKLWRYDAEEDAWEAVDMEAPSAADSLCVFNDDLLFVGGYYDDVFEGVDNVCAARVDLENLTLSPIKAKAGSKVSSLTGSDLQTVASYGKIYVYLREDDDSGSTNRFFRLTYDRELGEVAIEDLSVAFSKVAPSPEDSSESGASKAHVAFAGLPVGVAFVGSALADDGSYELGQDTHIIYDDATEAEKFERTSSYHRAFDPLATLYEGSLYAAGQNATEPDAMYFRSTKMWDMGEATKTPTCTEDGARTLTCLYGENAGNTFSVTLPKLGHFWGTGTVAEAASAGVAGVRVFTCAQCGAVKTEAIPALPGGVAGKPYTIGGNTYKVTSNAKSTVTLSRAKNAKKVTVPATVKIQGKTYQVTAIGAKAFASAKKKLKSAVIGKNVSKIGKAAFKGCKKLKTLIVKTKKLTKKSVKGCLKGSAVKTVKVKVGKAKVNKRYAKKYAKYFKKSNSGRKVAVKA